MHRLRIILMCLLMVMVLGVTWVVAGQVTKYEGSEGALCIPIGSFVIAPPESVVKQRAAVDFPHSRHFVYNCKRCHHKWDNTSRIQNCMASGCHNQVTAPEKPLQNGKYTDAAMKYYKYAYHGQCRGCHKELEEIRSELAQSAREPEKAPSDIGPTGCVECHPEE